MLTENAENPVITNATARPAWLGRVLRVEWLGQTIASLCWIVSVFAYEGSPGSIGDYLQLCAASAWLMANIATALNPRSD